MDSDLNPFPRMRAPAGAIGGFEIGVEPQTNNATDLPYTATFNKFDLRIDGRTYGLVDGVIPTVTTSHPSQFALLPPGTLSIAGTADDDSSGVDRVLVSLQRELNGLAEHWNGASWQSALFWIEATVSQNDWHINDVNLSENANYQIAIRAYDVAGNHATVESNEITNFIVLANPPVITEPTNGLVSACLLYTSPSPRDRTRSRMPSSA